jgi:DNA repair exonuclease SbcCD nuclease subunit
MGTTMNRPSYDGILAIGDPHLASRVPGFRKDDYPHDILGKLEWCLGYARDEHLLPCILGDLFHWPRDNANWLLGTVLELLTPEVLGISGNHDCAENSLSDDDSLSVIVRAGRIRLVDRTPWRGTIGDRSVVIGGTSWGQRLPDAFPADNACGDRLWVVWLTHHDVLFPGYEDAGHITPRAIPGIDVVINGHIHRSLADVLAGETCWVNPGNISRIKRTDSTRDRVPTVLRINVSAERWQKELITVPHKAFEELMNQRSVTGWRNSWLAAPRPGWDCVGSSNKTCANLTNALQMKS